MRFLYLTIAIFSLMSFAGQAKGQTCALNFNAETQKEELRNLMANISTLPPGSIESALLRKSFETKLSELRSTINSVEFETFLSNLRSNKTANPPRLADQDNSSVKTRERAVLLGPRSLRNLEPTFLRTTPLEELIKISGQKDSQHKFNRFRKFTVLETTEKILLFKKEKKYIYIEGENKAFALDKRIYPHLLTLTDDGQALAFYNVSRNQLHVWKKPHLLSNEFTLDNSEVFKLPPVYNPDGLIQYSKITLSNDGQHLVISDSWKHHNLISIKSQKAELFISNEGADPQFRFSPDSQKLAAIRDNFLSVMEISASSFGPFKDQIYVGDLLLKSLEWNSQSDDLAAVFSQYGSQAYVFTLKRAKFIEQVLTKSISGTPLNNLVTTWSPNGQFFAVGFQAQGHEAQGLVVNPTQLESIPFRVTNLTLFAIDWQSDSKILLVGPQPTNKAQLWSSPIEVIY